jgi:carbonic anhydrase
MDTYQKLLNANNEWVREKLNGRADFFSSMAESQHPSFLWIGCSDSRVPAELITGCGPGELFVHRNIANLVPWNDLNSHSVLQYAVEALKVPHVIVCGHYGCGGVKHGMTNEDLGLLNSWLENIRVLHRSHAAELEKITDSAARHDRMVEINVKQQIQNVAHTDIIQKAWKAHRKPQVHGWIYNLRTGYLQEVETLNPE